MPSGVLFSLLAATAWSLRGMNTGVEFKAVTSPCAQDIVWILYAMHPNRIIASETSVDVTLHDGGYLFKGYSGDGDVCDSATVSGIVLMVGAEFKQYLDVAIGYEVQLGFSVESGNVTFNRMAEHKCVSPDLPIAVDSNKVLFQLRSLVFGGNTGLTQSLYSLTPPYVLRHNMTSPISRILTDGYYDMYFRPASEVTGHRFRNIIEIKFNDSLAVLCQDFQKSFKVSVFIDKGVIQYRKAFKDGRRVSPIETCANKGLGGGVIAAIVIGSIALLMISLILLHKLWRSKTKNEQYSQPLSY